MKQLLVIEYLRKWLEDKFGQRLTVKSDHTGEGREELGLFLTPKLRGEGRSQRIAQVDIIGLNEIEKRVQFVIEVDPVSTPKKLLGDLAAVALADNHTPSNCFESYKIEGASFFFLTVLSDNPASGKRRQYESLETATLSLYSSLSNKLTNIRLCHGVDSQEMISAFQAAIETIYFSSVDVEF